MNACKRCGVVLKETPLTYYCPKCQNIIDGNLAEGTLGDLITISISRPMAKILKGMFSTFIETIDYELEKTSGGT